MIHQAELGGSLTSFRSFYQFALDCIAATILMRNKLQERVNDTLIRYNFKLLVEFTHYLFNI